jgi:hypothetical protein
VNAYECDANGNGIANPTAKTQSSMVHICIKICDNNDVVITDIKELRLKSDTIVSKAISGSEENVLTEVNGEGTTKKVKITTQMASVFFSDLGARTDIIKIVGTAVMEFKAGASGSRTRKLVRISSTHQKNGNVSDMDHKINGKDDVGDVGLGEFKMKVGISGSSLDTNSAATSGASNALSVTPLVTMTSLALGGVLMHHV